MPNLSFYDRQHIQKLLQQKGSVKYLFDDFVRGVGPLLAKWSEKDTSDVWVRNANIENAVEKRLTALHDALTKNIETYGTDAWNRSNTKNDNIVRSFIEGMSLSDSVRDGMFARNHEALKSLLKEKQNGLTISDRVWNITGGAKENLEFYLSSGLSSGRPAAMISQDVRQLLNDPDRRFHRVRNEQGKLVMSKPMAEYHPGQGVYRSSYKNALRLSATETNRSYRMADHERWKDMDFVTGIKVSRSPAHKGPCPICDALVGDYPKDFVFTGWHPWCICIAVPNMLDHEEFVDYLITGEVQNDKFVPDVPERAKSYFNEHSDQIENSYYGKTNFIDGKVSKGYVFKEKYHEIEIKNKLIQTQNPEEKKLYVAFEPFSPIIMQYMSRLKSEKMKQNLLKEVIDDSSFNVLFKNEKASTLIHPLHRGVKTKIWEETKQMAKDLNASGKKVAFLPEYKQETSADAITILNGKYKIADFKYSTTTNWNTLSKELIKGFKQADSIVLKLKNMDVDQFINTIEYVKRNSAYGSIVLINKDGNVIDITRDELRKSDYIKKILGFL